MAKAQSLEEVGFKQDLHRLGEGVQTLKMDVEGLAHEAADAARSGVAELREGALQAVETAKGKLDDVKDAAVDKFEHARDAAADAADSLKHVIARNPIASIGVAAGVGFLIGLVVFRHRS